MTENYGVDNPLEQEIKQLEDREARNEANERRAGRWNGVIAITISVYAVLAAVTGLLESRLTTEALVEMDNAVLLQAQASDQWSYFDSKSVKNDTLKALTAVVGAMGTPAAQKVQRDFAQGIAKFEADKAAIQEKAKELEKQRDEKIAGTSRLVRQHRRAGLAISLLQVAIVLASTASLLKVRALWGLSLVVAAAGMVYVVPLIIPLILGS